MKLSRPVLAHEELTARDGMVTAQHPLGARIGTAAVFHPADCTAALPHGETSDEFEVRESQAELTKFAQALERVALESAAGGTITGGQRGLRFQRSLLVKKSDRKKLESVLARFSRRWAEVREIECTGPWPPYSFVSEETGGAK